MDAATRDSDDLSWLSAAEMQKLIASGEISPVAVVENVLARIEQLDPLLKTFSYVDRDGARQAAKRAEAAVRRGDPLGPLHGIPVSVKDHIPVAKMPGHVMPNAASGEAAPVSRVDHFGIERLRKAGAIIIGTNTMMGAGGGGAMSGAALFQKFNWDAEARNPWDTTKVPGWSSSGGAAAVAAGIIPLAIGSDGGGSTRLPAAYSGVVGVHPTGGLIPEVNYVAPRPPAGITVGPLTRCVRDAALVTQVMAGPDGRDPFCIQTDPEDYMAGLDLGLAGLRLAWTDDFGFAERYHAPESDRIIALVRGKAHALSAHGAQMDVTTEIWEDIWPGRMAQWLSFFPTPGLALPSQEELQAGFEVRGRNWDRFHRLFKDHDLILSVTSARIARPIQEWEEAWTSAGPTYPNGNFLGSYCSHTDMFNWLKFPAISVPCGFIDAMPVGLQIAGPPGSEAKIFRAAQAFLKIFPAEERPPTG